ncbi:MULTISPECIES: tripartite tricarboxylate transporter substrate-binding protein [unclassified Variovorax]|uniref:tripartite tricarboxylate transporter substrate-binding protein n=1 Tax=unclassified Variovorax TaxID=663243 RepID=UPI001BD5BA6B|nr:MULTISPECIES: tripartite tricarboxylate transporter substrate-binding protein [unclassified Variovorax]
MKKLLAFTAVAAAAVAATLPAQAQDFPAGKPITIIVPFAAGGPTDRVARDLAESMRKPLGDVSIIVDNAAGAGSTIGNAKAARAKADGYTLLLTHVAMATTPVLYRKLPYNYETDFEYLGMINDVPMTVIGKPQLEAKNFKELRDWIGKSGGKVNLGNAGIGSASHLCGLLFQSELKADMTAVPYKGTAPAIADLIGGQIDILCDQTTNTTSQIEGKKVIPYGVTTVKRLTTPALKDIPTLDESGLKGFQVTIWHGLYAPKGTPAPVLKKINDALKIALKDPEFIKKEEGLGAVVVHDKRVEPAEHKKFVQAEVARFGPVIKAAGQYAD